MFKISTDCHIKHADQLNGGLFWKFLVPSFRKTYALSVGFKIKLLRKSIFKTKTKPNFAVKTCWEEQPFIFTLYFDESHFSNICTF